MRPALSSPMKKAPALSPADYLTKILNARVYDVPPASALQVAQFLTTSIPNTVRPKPEDKPRGRSFNVRVP